MSVVSLHGRKLGFNQVTNHLESNGVKITLPAVDAAITVGDESTNVRDITVQLKDANGANVAERYFVHVFVFKDAAGAEIVATGGSTGIAIGATGKILETTVAKKHFIVSTTATGGFQLTWTDTGTEAAYLGVQLPNGRMVISSALTNA